MRSAIVTAHRNFFQYIKANKVILLAFLFSFVCFGYMLTHYSLTIDGKDCYDTDSLCYTYFECSGNEPVFYQKSGGL